MTAGNQRALYKDMKREQGATKAALTLSPGLASKLASIAVHADELFSPDGRIGFDTEALKQSARDPEVLAWVKVLGPLAPVKRR